MVIGFRYLWAAIDAAAEEIIADHSVRITDLTPLGSLDYFCSNF